MTASHKVRQKHDKNFGFYFFLTRQWILQSEHVASFAIDVPRARYYNQGIAKLLSNQVVKNTKYLVLIELGLENL